MSYLTNSINLYVSGIICAFRTFYNHIYGFVFPLILPDSLDIMSFLVGKMPFSSLGLSCFTGF